MFCADSSKDGDRVTSAAGSEDGDKVALTDVLC
jgi:hypothetical protein